MFILAHPILLKTIATDPNPKIQRQILRELSFLKTCQSPHIVSFYGAFLDDGDTTVTLCMEYCEAGSLEDIYKRASELGGVIGEPVLERIAESVSNQLFHIIQGPCDLTSLVRFAKVSSTCIRSE